MGRSALAGLRRRTGGSSLRARRAAPGCGLRDRAAVAGLDRFGATALLGLVRGAGGALAGCAVVEIGRRAARSIGAGGGGGGVRTRCFGRAGLGSGFGAGFGSGTGGGGGASASVVALEVGAVGLWRGEAWPASAPEVANPSMQRPVRTSVASPTERERDGAAPAPRFIAPSRSYPGLSARER